MTLTIVNKQSYMTIDTNCCIMCIMLLLDDLDYYNTYHYMPISIFFWGGGATYSVAYGKQHNIDEWGSSMTLNDVNLRISRTADTHCSNSRHVCCENVGGKHVRKTNRERSSVFLCLLGSVYLLDLYLRNDRC